MMKPTHFPTALPPPVPAEFDAKEWNRLTAHERVRRCLHYAHEAMRFGSEALPDAKEAYVKLSQQWLALAMEIEKTADAGLG